MSVLKSYVDAPKFYDNLELSAIDYNTIRNNAELLKAISKRPEALHEMHRIIQIPQTNWVWRGGFQYRVGMTTARFIYYSNPLSGAGIGQFTIYFDGVARYTANTNIGGYSTIDIAINGLGYTDQQIITVEIIQTEGVGSNVFKNQVWLLDAYTFPLSTVMTTSWPGLPTFGSLNQTNLNQLSNAEDWLAQRMSLVPIPHMTSMIYWQGINQNGYWPTFYFTTRLTNSNRHFRTVVLYECHVDSGYFRLNINGANYDYGPYTEGDIALLDIDLDLSSVLSDNVDYVSSMGEYVAFKYSGPSQTRRNSRISTNYMFMDNPAHSQPTPPQTYNITQNTSFSDLQSRLNTISTQLGTVYSNINSNPRAFDRAHMFRSRFGLDAGQNEYWAKEMIAATKRQGEILWVKGQGLRIGYGPLTTKVTTTDEKWDWTFEREEDLTSGDAIEQKYFFLDQFEGLYPGQYYYIFGKDIIYAAEYIR